jgi:hypothetical protein
MTTTVCDAVGTAGTVVATLSSVTADELDLFLAAGWLSTAVTEALEDQWARRPVLVP